MPEQEVEWNIEGLELNIEAEHLKFATNIGYDLPSVSNSKIKS